MQSRSKDQRAAPLAAPRAPRPEGSAKARRTAARLAAVQVLYQIDVSGVGADAALADFLEHGIGEPVDGERLLLPDRTLLTDVVRGVADRRADVDGLVQGSLTGHQLERLEVLLRAILRAGCYELLAMPDTQPRIVINDYVDVAHGFFAGREPNMVNGVLDRIGRVLRPDDMAAPAAGPRETQAEP